MTKTHFDQCPECGKEKCVFINPYACYCNLLDEQNQKIQLIEACKLLVESFITGDHYQTMNPYIRTEVIAGLEALKECGITNEYGEWKEKQNGN